MPEQGTTRQRNSRKSQLEQAIKSGKEVEKEVSWPGNPDDVSHLQKLSSISPASENERVDPKLHGIYSVCFLGSENELAIGDTSGFVERYTDTISSKNIRKLQLVPCIHARNMPLMAMKFFPNKNDDIERILVAGADGSVWSMTTDSSEPISREYYQNTNVSIFSLALRQDSQYFAFAGNKDVLEVYDMKTGAPYLSFGEFDTKMERSSRNSGSGRAYHEAVTFADKHLVSHTWDGTLKIYDLQSKYPTSSIQGSILHGADTLDATDLTNIVMASWNLKDNILIFDTRKSDKPKVVMTLPRKCYASGIKLSKAGIFIATGCLPRNSLPQQATAPIICLGNSNTEEWIHSQDLPFQPHCLDISPDKRFCVTGSMNGKHADIFKVMGG